MASIVLERRFDEPVTEEMIEAMKAKTEPCLEVNAVTRVKTYITPDRKRFVCVFEAADAEAVRRAFDSAGMGYDEVWPAQVF
jgi:hypothetical protein